MDYLTYKKGFLPSDFWWKAVLGSKVTFYHLDLFFHSQHFRTMLQEKVDINDRFLCGFHRVWLTNSKATFMVAFLLVKYQGIRSREKAGGSSLKLGAE
ncbi:MAG: hypothetical protein MSB80_07425 [Alphaproteobacteria bacterium]|nr:hypothetical protein [Alphaproteobacteria bacterium]